MLSTIPMQSSDTIGILLKEHNARVISNMHEIRHSTQVCLISFVDKLVETMARKCACCKIHGMDKCVMLTPHSNTGKTSSKSDYFFWAN